MKSILFLFALMMSFGTFAYDHGDADHVSDGHHMETTELHDHDGSTDDAEGTTDSAGDHPLVEEDSESSDGDHEYGEEHGSHDESEHNESGYSTDE
ncbi:hypothetical protein [Photobacterium leiognathi]|uniref:hypothetical protein n=1 Tax=Photobacterium leiognathi TaxID=553611 RepID=UPI00273A2BFE|nr:hypothetical protein [Photobacterium leiognathi]